MSFLSLSGISKRFGENVIIHPLDLEVKQGEFFFLLGPSGCGKTTLLKIISGLLYADSGQITLNGVDISQTPPHKRDINTVFQNYALFPHMNVFENVAFGLRMKKISEDVIRSKVNDALKLVALADYGSRKPGQLSGGQMQRVALARAFINEPAVLLLDEPLGALDVKLRKQMQIELKQIQRELGTTFICVTHDQEEALTMGDRIAVMKDGRFEQIGDASTIYNNPVSHFVCDFLGDCNFLEITALKSDDDFNLACFENTWLRTKKRSINDLDAIDAVIAIRPEKIRIDDVAEVSSPFQESINQLRVKVEDVIFSGSLFTIMATTPSGARLNVSIHNKGIDKVPTNGDEVNISWNANDTIILQSGT
jgi:spermidine/putrescine transport system ATP-binding protein